MNTTTYIHMPVRRKWNRKLLTYALGQPGVDIDLAQANIEAEFDAEGNVTA